MDFAVVTVKESPGLCRCCLSEGCYKDLGTEYTWMNDTEVYADMLLDCFDIGITQHNDGPNGAKRLICEVCITRLRDACNFKKQVVDSERKFIDMLGRGEFRHMEKENVNALMPIYSNPMKAEAIEEVTVSEDYDDSHVEFLDDADFTEDEELVKRECVTAPVASTSSTKRGRPKKTESEPPPEKKSKLKAKSKIPKGGKRQRNASAKSQATSLSATKRNRLMKRNATIILQNCTALPFKWHRQYYLCFFCHKSFDSFDEVKKHTNTEHDITNVRSAVSFLRLDNKVKIDVSSWNCKLCDFEPDNVDDFVDHLKFVHNKEFEDAEYGVIAYKHLAGSFVCAFCDARFAYFVKLNQHMNKHFGKYVCDVCGKLFLSAVRLRTHALIHTSGGVRCDHCPEIFRTTTIKRTHINKVHVAKIKCQLCNKIFLNYNQRKMHLKMVHNLGLLFACPDCGKEFPCNSRMEQHLKEVHYKENNFHCLRCDKWFCSKWQLTKHVQMRHTEKFECKECGESFPDSNTLDKHMESCKHIIASKACSG